MTKKEMIKQIVELGLTVSVKNGEIRVNRKGGNEDSAYYTDDRQDAVDTAKAMAGDFLPAGEYKTDSNGIVTEGPFKGRSVKGMIKPEYHVRGIVTGRISGKDDLLKHVGPAPRLKVPCTPEELRNAKGRQFDFMDAAIKDEIQLHEQIEIHYVVDGWIAQYSPDDGNTWPIAYENESPMIALAQLCHKIHGLKAKRISEGRSH